MPSLAAHAAPVRPLHASLPPRRRFRRFRRLRSLRSQLRSVRSVWCPGGVGSRLVAVFLLVIRDEVHASTSREDARSRVVSSFAAHAARFDTVTDPWWFRSFGLVVGLTPTSRGGFGLGRLGSGPGDSRARGAGDVVVVRGGDVGAPTVERAGAGEAERGEAGDLKREALEQGVVLARGLQGERRVGVGRADRDAILGALLAAPGSADVDGRRGAGGRGGLWFRVRARVHGRPGSVARLGVVGGGGGAREDAPTRAVRRRRAESRRGGRRVVRERRAHPPRRRRRAARRATREGSDRRPPPAQGRRGVRHAAEHAEPRRGSPLPAEGATLDEVGRVMGAADAAAKHCRNH